jgi:hypothetical protein
MNSRARRDVRVSVQGLFTFIGGLGLLAGNLAAGWVRHLVGGNLGLTFGIAALLAVALTIVFLAGFSEQEWTTPRTAEAGSPAPAPETAWSAIESKE